jgi:hypothetical protein
MRNGVRFQIGSLVGFPIQEIEIIWWTNQDSGLVMILVDRRSVLSDKTDGPIEKVLGINKMLSRCANPECGTPFLKLREGKLFLVETERVTKPALAVPPFVRARKLQRSVEHYWLCDECAAEWTLAYDRDRGISLVPLRRSVRSMESMDRAARKATSGAA